MINFTLTILSLVITAITTIVVIMAFVEWRKLSQLKKDLENNLQQYQEKINKTFNAAHKVLASYQVENAKAKIVLLEQATAIQPDVYNGYNALGYAHIEDNNLAGAVEAFTKAIMYHPEDPAGYCDLAYAYLLHNNKDACKRNLEKAILLDPQQKEIIDNDKRFQEILI